MPSDAFFANITVYVLLVQRAYKVLVPLEYRYCMPGVYIVDGAL